MRAAVFLSKWFHVASTEWFVGVFVNFGGCVLSKFFFFKGISSHVYLIHGRQPMSSGACSHNEKCQNSLA